MKIISILLAVFLFACGGLAPVLKPPHDTVPAENPLEDPLIQLDPAFITVEFDPVLEPNIAGYIIYWGTQSLTYPHRVPIGKVTVATINGFSPGTQYFMAVTAFDTAGLESDYSNEISFTISIAPIAWISSVDEPKITNEKFSFSDDPLDHLKYFYTHFQFKAKPNVRYRLERKMDLNVLEWELVDTFFVRPKSSNPLADQDIFCNYRYTPTPQAVFYRVTAVN